MNSILKMEKMEPDLSMSSGWTLKCPVMDGIEAITMIRSSEKIISQPYIVRLSSGLDHREAGEDAFLCQPYTKKSIEQLLLVAVQYRELKKELLKLRAKQQK
eukprot:TRINITY_DN2790_c0_g1_i3.p1 TRINITY_DN2790_c0_g1~~TRINITY_DN2790_c0_g1_i3.p1  ORF type:complete len:102 (+),score=21.00 TRINITY_DN2790_c0_g1_i3:243-548(+)